MRLIPVASTALELKEALNEKSSENAIEEILARRIADVNQS